MPVYSDPFASLTLPSCPNFSAIWASHSYKSSFLVLFSNQSAWEKNRPSMLENVPYIPLVTQNLYTRHTTILSGVRTPCQSTRWVKLVCVAHVSPKSTNRCCAMTLTTKHTIPMDFTASYVQIAFNPTPFLLVLFGCCRRSRFTVSSYPEWEYGGSRNRVLLWNLLE